MADAISAFGGFFLGLVTGVMVMMLFGVFVIGPDMAHTAIRKEQQKAIEADVGRWEIDPRTGAKEFRYGVPAR